MWFCWGESTVPFTNHPSGSTSSELEAGERGAGVVHCVQLQGLHQLVFSKRGNAPLIFRVTRGTPPNPASLPPQPSLPRVRRPQGTQNANTRRTGLLNKRYSALFALLCGVPHDTAQRRRAGCPLAFIRLRVPVHSAPCGVGDKLKQVCSSPSLLRRVPWTVRADRTSMGGYSVTCSGALSLFKGRT